MKITIKKVNGKWLINGKQYNQLSTVEKSFFDEFIVAMRMNYDLENLQDVPDAENYIGEKIQHNGKEK